MECDTKPGRRGRARCSRTASRSGGGLRLFSVKVIDKIRASNRTDQKAVADELVADRNLSGGSTKDGKSIRRRCYDAINVLEACGLIEKEGRKQIVWRGHANVELDRLKAEVEKKARMVEQKIKVSQAMERDHQAMEEWLALHASLNVETQDCGSGTGVSSSACSHSSEGHQCYPMPLMLVQGPVGAKMEWEHLNNNSTVTFELEAPLEVHDAYSVVMQFVKHEAERQANHQANQQSRKESPPVLVKQEDSAHPSPGPQTAGAAGPSAGDLSTRDMHPGQQASVEPAPVATPSQQQQEEALSQLSQYHEQSQQQQVPLTQLELQERLLQTQQVIQELQSQQLQQQQLLQKQKPLLQEQKQERQAHHSQRITSQQKQRPPSEQARPSTVSQPSPSHQAIPISLAPHPQQEYLAPPPPLSQQSLDFLSNLKPLSINRSRALHRPHMYPTASCSEQGGALQTQTQAELQQPPSASHVSLPQLQSQVGFTHMAGSFYPFLCARPLEQQLQPLLPCVPSTGSRSFQPPNHHHNHHSLNLLAGGEGDRGGPPTAHTSFEAQGPHVAPIMHSLALHFQQAQPGVVLQPSQQAQQLQQEQQQQHHLPSLGDVLAPSPPSLYSLEQMAEEQLPQSLLPFTAEDADPLGFGINTASQVYDQLAYMGWPFASSPDPFSPSAFLVTPSFMKGPCRSEQTRSVGAVQAQQRMDLDWGPSRRRMDGH